MAANLLLHKNMKAKYVRWGYPNQHTWLFIAQIQKSYLILKTLLLNPETANCASRSASN